MYNKPLVSIIIPNYNYGRYLENCFESILKQSYDNYEIIFRDNNSTDNSYEIALKYKKEFEKKGIFFSLTRNKRNVGSDRNSELCLRECNGSLRYFLASDDAINPTFLERCVDIFVKYPSVGMVMVHREEMDDEGNIYTLPPFYDCNCIVPSESQAAVFMMAGIAIPGQRMLRAGILLDYKDMKRSYQVAGDWFTNFLNSCEGDVAYIKEPLCRYRVHPGNETNESEKNMMAVFEHFQLITYFTDIAKELNMPKVWKRYDEAVQKLGGMCLRYAMRMIQEERFAIARKYLYLAPVFSLEIVSDTQYKELKVFLDKDVDYMRENKNVVLRDEILERKKSYSPPEDAVIFY